MLIKRNKNLFYPNMGNIPPFLREIMKNCTDLNTGKKFRVLILLDYLILMKDTGVTGTSALQMFNAIFLRHKLFSVCPSKGADEISLLLNEFLEIFRLQDLNRLMEFFSKINREDKDGEYYYKIEV